jgi:hypothetical protein
MNREPSQEMIDEWHRWFAVACNNRAWDLIDRAIRTEKDNREMLLNAFAAAYHWSKVGTLVHVARADMLLARVYSMLKDPDQALAYARGCLAFFEKGQGEDWDLAFAHAEMALAAATAGDVTLHIRHYAVAQVLGAAIKDPEDRQIFLDEFKRIPKPEE